VDTKILIITDDRYTKDRLVLNLTRTHMRILSIPTEPGGLGSHLSQADLIILDLPRADTKKFRFLRQVRGLSMAPVILLVPDDDHRVSVRGLDCGADHVMSKPVNYNELRARIRALLRRIQIEPGKPGDPWGAPSVSGPEAPSVDGKMAADRHTNTATP
jgi:DNA-binding response OmpR family regulator